MAAVRHARALAIASRFADTAVHADHSFNLHDFADDDPPNFKTFADAARAGNPDAALAFNPGQAPWLPSLSAHQDFTAGEIGVREQFPSPNGRRFSNLNAQYHNLTYLGPLWGCFLKAGGHNASCLPRFTASELASAIDAYTTNGWAITLDTPVHDNGTIYAGFLEQLRARVHAARHLCQPLLSRRFAPVPSGGAACHFPHRCPPPHHQALLQQKFAGLGGLESGVKGRGRERVLA